MKREWTVLNFGPHGGWTLPQVLFYDPDWFFYNARGLLGTLGDDADELYQKVTHIKIPGKRIVQYVLDLDTCRVKKVKFLPKSRGLKTNWLVRPRATCIDLSFPVRLYGQSAKPLIRAVKRLYFGHENARPRARKCEAFFENERNFVRDPAE